MKDEIIQLLMALLGSLGFALLFKIRNKLLPAAAVGGFINWGAYLLFCQVTDIAFLACFGAAAVSVIYCEIAARILKAPITLFLVPSIVPLVPGSSLFYTMSSIVRNDWTAAKHFGLLTTEFALGIAAGICLSTVVFSIINRVMSKKLHKLG